MIRSMENEASGRRKSRKRANPNELGMLPVGKGSLNNVFGGLDYGGMDSGMMGMNPLSDFGETCVDCNDDQQQKLKHKKEIFRKDLHSHKEGYMEGYDLANIGGAFNGRFGQIGGGFLESVNSGKGGAIDYDRGAKRNDAVSPVFQIANDGAVPSVFKSGEGYGIKRGRLEKSAEREGRQIARARTRKEKAETKAKAKRKKEGKVSAEDIGERGETRFERLKRRFEERQRKRQAQSRYKKTDGGFTSTKVPLGRGAGSGDFTTGEEE